MPRRYKVRTANSVLLLLVAGVRDSVIDSGNRSPQPLHVKSQGRLIGDPDHGYSPRIYSTSSKDQNLPYLGDERQIIPVVRSRRLESHL